MNTRATSREVAQSQRGDSAVATATAITRYIHPDNLGSTNVTSDANGNLSQWLDYAPFGSVLASENTGTTTAARQYIGQFSDASGLSYLNSRYYNGAQGQFVSEDPVFLALGNPTQLQQLSQQQQNQLLMDPQALNSYSYSEDNPISLKDPLGLGAQIFSGNPVVAALEYFSYLSTLHKVNLVLRWNNEQSFGSAWPGEAIEIYKKSGSGRAIEVGG
jgi:RHS repeat-associated protein